MPLDPSTNLLGDWSSTDGANQPPGGDKRNQGDDQLRGIKGSLKRTFPQFVGSPGGIVNVTEQELNQLDGIGTAQTVETRLAALEAGDAKFPGGNTVFLLFRNQVSAIPGWTQVTTTEYDNAIMRVVNTAGALSQGGSDSPILNNKVPTHNHPASSSTTGAHKHDIYQPAGPAGSDTTFSNTATAPTQQNLQRSGPIVSNGNHSHPITVDNNVGGSNWEPKYLDSIVASKD